MQVKTFLLTLGVGVAAGGAIALMLPPHSKVRRTVQNAVDSIEQSMTDKLP